MQEQNLNEVWQVEVNGTIYEAPFHELGEWIEGGSLQPEDKVRKGNLRWIEARRVPPLVPFFNAKVNGEPMPVMVNTTVAEPTTTAKAQTVSGLATGHTEPSVTFEATPPTIGQAAVADQTRCANHSDVESVVLCDGCGNGFCKACPRSFGGTVKICPLCGALCRASTEVKEARRQADRLSKAMDEGFGMADFFSSLGYPFRFKSSLLFGAVMFMLFSLGGGAGALGGIFLVATGLISSMLANAVTFGVLANTINNFVQGKVDENFMPDFEGFSLWDDVAQPFLLSIAAYISSFGPFVAVIVIAVYLVLSSVAAKTDAFQSDLEKIPGTNVYAGRKLAEQSEDVKDVLKGIEKKNNDRAAAVSSEVQQSESDTVTSPETTPFVNEESREQERIWEMAAESRKQSLESTLGKTPETREREQAEMIQSILRLAAPIVVMGAITFLWGLFFFPAACAVAGYTRSFVATINPLVGLDTIKRLGVDYVKILLMSLVLLVISIFVSFVLGAIFAVFDLPGIGNLPAKAVGALLTFYIWVAFSCILGFALFKSGDKLGLSR